MNETSIAVHVEYLKHYLQNEWGPLTYATEGDACFDLHAAIRNSVVLIRGAITIIPTGIKLALPKGYEIQIRPRSGFTVKQGVIVANSPGTIDSGYRGEVKIALLSLVSNEVIIRPGDRVAQAKVSVVPTVHFVNSTNVARDFESERGEGGFGHTGI